jgi:succinyl-diaminopimelate desuccinylase
MADQKKLCAEVERLRDEMVTTLTELIRIPAISPDYGYEGEWDKAAALREILEGWSFDRIEQYDAPDERAKKGVRPNILAFYEGEDPEAPRLWILTHLDVVPPGDPATWTVTEPFNPLVKGGKVYGRGSDEPGDQAEGNRRFGFCQRRGNGKRPWAAVARGEPSGAVWRG